MTQKVNDCSDILVECIMDKINKGNKILPFRRLVKISQFPYFAYFHFKFFEFVNE